MLARRFRVVVCATATLVIFGACVSRPGATPGSTPPGATELPAASPSQGATAEPAADGLCSTAGASEAEALTGGAASLIASFPSTAAAVASWEETRGPTDGPHPSSSEWRSHPPREFVAVCYFDGVFNGVTRPPGAPPYERAVLLVMVGGMVTIDSFGSRGSIQAIPPVP